MAINDQGGQESRKRGTFQDKHATLEWPRVPKQSRHRRCKLEVTNVKRTVGQKYKTETVSGEGTKGGGKGQRGCIHCRT